MWLDRGDRWRMRSSIGLDAGDRWSMEGLIWLGRGDRKTAIASLQEFNNQKAFMLADLL